MGGIEGGRSSEVVSLSVCCHYCMSLYILPPLPVLALLYIIYLSTLVCCHYSDSKVTVVVATQREVGSREGVVTLHKGRGR